MSVISRSIEWARDVLEPRWLGKFVAAVTVGLGVGIAFSGEPVTLPVFGGVPAVAAGGLVLVVGAVSFWLIRDPNSDCDCEGTCTCS